MSVEVEINNAWLHKCFFQSFLCVLACKLLELMVNQKLQSMFDFFFSRLPYFPVGGLPEQGNAVNKFISIRICIYTIILFLLLKIKYFGVKVFIFTGVLCLPKKKKNHLLDSSLLCFQVFFSSWKEKDKGQILVPILVLHVFSFTVIPFLLVPGWWIGYLGTVKT